MCLFIFTAAKQDKQHHEIWILFLTYLINEHATKWMAEQTNEQKPQVWTRWQHMKPPTAAGNLLLASFHGGSHLCLSRMPISLACWPHYSLTLQLLNPPPGLRGKKKRTLPIYFSFMLFNFKNKDNVFSLIIWLTWTLSRSRHKSGSKKCKKRKLRIREN